MCIMFLLSYIRMPTQQHSNPMNRIQSCEVHVYNTMETTAILVCELQKQSDCLLCYCLEFSSFVVLIACSDSQLQQS